MLDDNEVLYFSLSDLNKRINKNIHNLNELVENLYQKGFLIRIERGRYSRPQFTNVNVLASFISGGGSVAYWSALHQHGLTERFPNKVFIKNNNRKKNTIILGTPIQFVTVRKNKMIGITTTGYGYNSYNLTDTESTIIDCFDQPRYAGDWSDLLKAFMQSKLDETKLIDYAKAYGKKSIIKRLGYLSELLNKNELNGFVEFAQNYKGSKYNLFDITGPDRGNFNAKWKLILNMDEQKILETVQSGY